MEIADIAKSYGASVPFLRPKSLANANSTSISVIIHTLIELIKNKEDLPEIVVFKPPTNPFLSSKSIQEMINLKLSNRNTDSVMSIQIPKTSALSFLSFSNYHLNNMTSTLLAYSQTDNTLLFLRSHYQNIPPA